MFIEGVKSKGEFVAVLTDQFGNTTEVARDNLIVISGLAHIASRQVSAVDAAMGWIAIGTGTVAAAITDTLLGAEVNRVATTTSIVTTAQTGDTVQYIATFPPAGGANVPVTEAGIFNSATANTATMLNRVTFPVINKGPLDSLTITWRVRSM